MSDLEEKIIDYIIAGCLVILSTILLGLVGLMLIGLFILALTNPGGFFIIVTAGCMFCWLTVKIAKQLGDWFE